MKNLWNEVRASLSKSAIYSNPETASAGTAIGYMLKLMLVIVAIKTIVFSFAFVPLATQMRVLAGELVAKYPADLTLKIADGSLSMNKPSPLIVANSKENLMQSRYKNFLVIDTSKAMDLKSLSSYATSILLTKDGYMTIDKNGAIKAQSFRQFPDYTLSKSVLDTYTGKLGVMLGERLWAVTLALSIAMLIGLYVVGMIGAFFWSLVGTLGVLAVSKAKGYSLSFSQLYGVSMYAYTAVIAFEIVNIFLRLPHWIGAIVFLGILGLFMDKKAENATIA